MLAPCRPPRIPPGLVIKFVNARINVSEAIGLTATAISMADLASQVRCLTALRGDG